MIGSFGCKPRADKVGVLLAQTGTPDAPTPSALKKYLAQFLWDPRVIEANRASWWLILNGIILRTRPKRSAKLYSRIWSEKGSPLLYLTKSLSEQLRNLFQQEHSNVEVAFGMRYGSPSLENAVDGLIDSGCSKILLVPLYPQYAGPTTASTYDVVMARILKRRWVPTLRVAEPYFRNSNFLSSLSGSINSALKQINFTPEKLLISYHGIPARYVKSGDPYCCMCTATTHLVVPQINFDKSKILQVYQSRFGKEPWLEPYADETVVRLAKEGVKKIAVACPGFSIDCLETIDEIGHELKKSFLDAGGEEFFYIPSLNDSAEWVSALKKIVIGELGTWLTQDSSKVCEHSCPAKLAG